MTSSRTRAALVSLTVALGALSIAASADAASKECPAQKGSIISDSTGRVWHKGGSLYACTTVYGHAPKSRRLGKWAKTSRVAFDGVNVAWTVPLVKDGVRSDRVYGASADTGKVWLKGNRLLPKTDTEPSKEARIKRLIALDRGVAWLTRTGEVVMALEQPQDAPEAIGTLPAPLKAAKNLLLVGDYPTESVPVISESLKLEELEGDGDECGGVNPYKLTFVTSEGGTPAGATWLGGWTSTNCD